MPPPQQWLHKVYLLLKGNFPAGDHVLLIFILTLLLVPFCEGFFPSCTNVAFLHLFSPQSLYTLVFTTNALKSFSIALLTCIKKKHATSPKTITCQRSHDKEEDERSAFFCFLYIFLLKFDYARFLMSLTVLLLREENYYQTFNTTAIDEV